MLHHGRLFRSSPVLPTIATYRKCGQGCSGVHSVYGVPCLCWLKTWPPFRGFSAAGYLVVVFFFALLWRWVQVCCTMCPVNLSPLLRWRRGREGCSLDPVWLRRAPGWSLPSGGMNSNKKTNPRRHYELILDTFMGSVGIFCTGRYWLLLLFGGGPPHGRCWRNVYDGECRWNKEFVSWCKP